MAFVCPRCLEPALEVAAVIELPPDSRSDELSLQTLVCRACGFASLAVYEESRRGASESWDHTGYEVEEAERVRVAAAIAACPSPRSPRCGCASHHELGRSDAQGRWSGLETSQLRASFPLRRAPQS